MGVVEDEARSVEEALSRQKREGSRIGATSPNVTVTLRRGEDLIEDAEGHPEGSDAPCHVIVDVAEPCSMDLTRGRLRGPCCAACCWRGRPRPGGGARVEAAWGGGAVEGVGGDLVEDLLPVLLRYQGGTKGSQGVATRQANERIPRH